VAAGGDGTLSLVVNTVDLTQTTLAFLPFGTGNAVSRALCYRGDLVRIAERIRHGATHSYDLINCSDRRKAFMASLGFDGTAIRVYESYRIRGYHGFSAHLRSAAKAYFNEYAPTGAHIEVDGYGCNVRKLMSLMVVKQPFYGMGLKAVPQARWDDGQLHSLLVKPGSLRTIAGLITGFTIGNRAGIYRRGKNLSVETSNPVTLQVDGDLGWTGRRFTFAVLEKTMQLRH